MIEEMEQSPDKDFFKHLEEETTTFQYLDPEKVVYPDYVMKRLDTGHGRWYYRLIDGKPKFYLSVTSFIKDSLPTPKQLIKWISDMGEEKARAYMHERASYGSLMHSLFADLVIDKNINLDTIPARVSEYLETKKLSQELKIRWCEDLVKDILGFNQLLTDYEIVPIAIEITLCSDKHGIAGTLDFPCEMNDKLYTDKTPHEKRKRIRALIDFKSGRKGFHEDNEIQLAACARLWEENFPDKPPFEKVFNYAPKDWRKAPDYTLKDQTKELSLEKLPHLIALAHIESRRKMPSVFGYSGKVLYGGDMTGNYRMKRLEEIVYENN